MSLLLCIVTVLVVVVAVAATDIGWHLLENHPIITPAVVALVVGAVALILL